MKKNIILFFMFVCFGFSAQAQTVLTLDAAITKGSLQASAAIPKDAKVLVISYETPSKLFSDYVGDVLTSEFEAKMNRDMVRYRNVDTLCKDYKIEDGVVYEEKAIEIGKALKANFVILVTVKKFGETYQMNLQPINVAGGKKIQSTKYKVSEDDLTTELSKGPSLSEENSAPTESAVRRLRAHREAVS